MGLVTPPFDYHFIFLMNSFQNRWARFKCSNSTKDFSGDQKLQDGSRDGNFGFGTTNSMYIFELFVRCMESFGGGVCGMAHPLSITSQLNKAR